MTLTEEQREELAYVESMLLTFEEHIKTMKHMVRLIFDQERDQK